MKSRKAALLPQIKLILEEFGETIRLARLRRKLSAEQVSEQANIRRPTLLAVEKGSPGVAVSSYVQVLFVLGLEKKLLKLAEDDYHKELRSIFSR